MNMLSRLLNRLFSTQQSIDRKASFCKLSIQPFTLLSLLFISVAIGVNTQAQTLETQFFQGFEADSSNWFSPPPTRTASGGITASTGGFYGDIGNTNTFTRWGGYNTPFPTRGYTTSIDMYLDMSGGYANDTRLAYTSAINDATGVHRRDFVFSVGFYNDGGPFGSGNRFVMSASNNSPGNPRDVARSPYTITTTGWYKFRHRFYDSGGGVLAVEMSVIDSGGTVLNTWTLSNPSDIIGTTVGGNRYGWFSANGFPSIAIDNTQRANFVSIRNVDDDGMASATDCDASDAAFTTIQSAIDDAGTLSGDLINVCPGTYIEDVNVNKAGLRVIGANASTTTISGAIGGDGATVRVTANNVTVAGFTITREGNNTTDWNNAGLNSAGVAVQGQSITNMLIRDNNIVGNRSAIDVNNSNGHTIRNNVINNNHTGMILRNQTNNETVVENTITNNRTVGILFLDASGGTNSPLQQALNCRFNNNNISGNWYGEVVDRQTGGSLPAPGTTNFKDFRYNWLGSTSPVITVANSAEPGYSALIPVVFGGTATDPGGQPDLAGTASANIFYTPLLTSGTDTDVETVTGRGTHGFQGATALITVKPSMLNSWFFYNDETDVIDNALGSFVPGPATSPLGVGSAQISVTGTQRRNLATYQFAGTVLSNINELKYSTYNPSAGNGGSANRSGYLQFNVDFDGSDTWQRRLIFLPSDNGTVTQNTWQEWDAINSGNALWRHSGATWPIGVGGGGEPGTTTKTWSQVLSQYPGVRIRLTDAFLGIRVGEPYNDGYTENIDAIKFGTNAGSATFDFEPARPSVTINQASGQVDPTSTSPINFTAVFSEAVTGFDGSDVTVGGTAGATTAVVTGSGTTYNVAVSGMTGSGTVTASVVDSAASSVANSTPSEASTSTDNSVTFFTCNEVSIPTGITVPTNTQFTVPINVDDTTGRGILSYDFTLNYNPAVVIPIGVETTGTLSNGWVVTTNSGSGSLIVSGFNTAPMSGSGVLLNVKFISIGGIGTTSGLTLPSFMFNEGIPCTNVTNGDVTIISGTVSGKVTYGNSVTEKPVVRTTLSGAGSVNVSTMSDLGGLYTLSGFGSGAYTVTPTKTGDVNGISAFDSALIAQHVVGLITLNSTQGIVADVSANNAVTSFDAALIAQYVVAIPNPGITGTWKFTPVNRSYPNVTVNQTNQNYQALLMGEVSGNWTPPLSLAGLFDFDKLTQPQMTVSVTAPTMSSSPGAVLTVPLNVGDTSGQGIISYQYDLVYDHNVIQLQTNPCQVTGTLSSSLVATCNPATPGLLKVAVFGSMPVNGMGVLMNLKFNVVGVAGNVSPLNLQQFMFNEGVPGNAPINGQVNILGPTAASVGVGGQLFSSKGQGVPKARVNLTDTNGEVRTVISNSFGYYRFEGVEAGQTYTISVTSKNYTFTSQVISVVDNITDFDLYAEP